MYRRYEERIHAADLFASSAASRRAAVRAVNSIGKQIVVMQSGTLVVFWQHVSEKPT